MDACVKAEGHAFLWETKNNAGKMQNSLNHGVQQAGVSTRVFVM